MVRAARSVLRSFGPRWFVLAGLLFACLLTSQAWPGGVRADSTSEISVAGEQPTAFGQVAPSTAIGPLRATTPPRLGLAALILVLAVVGGVGASAFPRSRPGELLKAAPGRRGRACLQAYLN